MGLQRTRNAGVPYEIPVLLESSLEFSAGCVHGGGQLKRFDAELRVSFCRILLREWSHTTGVVEEMVD